MKGRAEEVAERMTGLLARSAARGIAGGLDRPSLPEAIGHLEQAEKEGCPEGFAKGRRSFYRSLLKLSGSAELARLFPSMQMTIVYAQHDITTLQALRLRDYRAIAKAILAGDVEAADTMGAAHVRNVRNVRNEVLKKVGVNQNSMVLSRYSAELATSQAKPSQAKERRC